MSDAGASELHPAGYPLSKDEMPEVPESGIKALHHISFSNDLSGEGPLIVISPTGDVFHVGYPCKARSVTPFDIHETIRRSEHWTPGTPFLLGVEVKDSITIFPIRGFHGEWYRIDDRSDPSVKVVGFTAFGDPHDPKFGPNA